MKKYRLGYDYVFLANKPFSYKNELIGAMSVDLLFKFFDKQGHEVLFESDKLIDQRLYFENGNSCYLNNFYNCFIDRNKTIKITPNVPLLKESGYLILFEIYSFDKDIYKGFLEQQSITKDEFMDIMRNNIDSFDTSTNSPTQSTSYFTYELNEIEVPEISGKKYPKVKPKERFSLEIVRKVEHIFRYESCEPLLVNKNIPTGKEARRLAISMKGLLQGKQFFLLTKYENERKVFAGKLYI